MSNTLIQIKRSTATNIPPNGSLAAGEQAYSYSSNTLFIGAPDGTGVIAIGGKYYVDALSSAYNHANAAFAVANTGAGANVGNAFAAANTARDHANAAFLQANTSRDHANASFGQANTALNVGQSAFGQANTGLDVGRSAFGQANTAQTTGQAAFGQANTARDQANTALNVGQSAFGQANTGRDQANTALTAGQAAFEQANTARTHANTAHATANAAFDAANATFASSNTKLSTSGGTITGNLAVVGSLTVSGNSYIIDGETLRVSDPLIYLAGNNYVSDIVDIGFIANYVNATGQNVHTGLYREHENKEYYLFQGYDAEPINNHIGAMSNNMTLAVLNADLKANSILLNGINVQSWIASAFSQANTGSTIATSAFLTANLGYAQANAASAQAANADFLTSGTVASARISGSYTNITGVGTIAAGTWQGNTIKVPYGGTGMVSFTTNGILYGNGAGDLKVTGAGTEGQVLQASATGVPQFGMLDGGTF